MDLKNSKTDITDEMQEQEMVLTSISSTNTIGKLKRSHIFVNVCTDNEEIKKMLQWDINSLLSWYKSVTETPETEIKDYEEMLKNARISNVGQIMKLQEKDFDKYFGIVGAIFYRSVIGAFKTKCKTFIEGYCNVEDVNTIESVVARLDVKLNERGQFYPFRYQRARRQVQIWDNVSRTIPILDRQSADKEIVKIMQLNYNTLFEDGAPKKRVNVDREKSQIAAAVITGAPGYVLSLYR
jgi:hypothetical protein